MPCTLAMTGCGMRRIASITSQQWRNIAPMNASFEWASISFRSWPGENALPAPAMTTTRTALSEAISSSAALSSANIALSIALYCAGRLSVSIAMPSASSRSNVAPDSAVSFIIRSLFDRARRSRALAQYELLDLAGRGLRQLAEDHFLRRLEAREMHAAVLDQVGLRDLRIRFDLHERARRFAPLRIGLRDDRSGKHRRMTIEHILDLERADVLAARNDYVL